MAAGSKALERFGKYLVAALEGGDRLLLHLGMTGQLFGAGASSVRLLSSAAGAALAPERQLAGFRPDAHTHLRLRFEDEGPDVFFRDVRKFGKVQLLRAGEPCERLERLGEDALQARGRRAARGDAPSPGSDEGRAARPVRAGGRRQHLRGRGALPRAHPPDAPRRRA